MCYAIKCKVCGKTTWSGCGLHISSVKQNVPEDQWCDGKHPETKKRKGIFSFLSR